MKKFMKAIATLTIVGVLLLGLTSCNATNSINPVNPTPVNNQAEVNTQTTVKIAPSSSTSTALNLLIKAYQAQNPATKFEFTVPGQYEGPIAIAAVKNNLADIAGTSRPLTPEENNGQLQYREFAKDLLVVATNRSVTGVTNLTTEQLRAIYRGDIINWQALGGPNATIVVLDRPEDKSAKILLRQYYLGKDQTTSNAILLPKEAELIQTLQDTPNAIGAFSLAYSEINQSPVNLLSLNGVAPNLENFNQGKYLMVRQMGIVWDKSPSDPTQAFIDFIFSSEGVKIIQENGFLPRSSTQSEARPKN